VSVVYLESSAVLAWLFGEPEAPLIRLIIDEADTVLSSPLTAAESRRALIRVAHDGGLDAASSRRLLALLVATEMGWTPIEMTDAVWQRAGQPFPAEPLRTLDALHLAAILQVAGLVADINVVTLDRRVSAAAAGLGLGVLPASSVP